MSAKDFTLQLVLYKNLDKIQELQGSDNNG